MANGQVGGHRALTIRAPTIGLEQAAVGSPSDGRSPADACACGHLRIDHYGTDGSDACALCLNDPEKYSPGCVMFKPASTRSPDGSGDALPTRAPGLALGEPACGRQRVVDAILALGALLKEIEIARTLARGVAFDKDHAVGNLHVIRGACARAAALAAQLLGLDEEVTGGS